MTKQELRLRIKQLSATYTQYKEDSARLCQKIISSAQFERAETILAYMALPDEADLTTVIKEALARKKKVYIPRVFTESATMEFFRCTKDTVMQDGAYGIQEPAETSSTEIFVPENFHEKQSATESSINKTLVLVPGRAFSEDGHRLGRGKGFYDKYLSRFPLPRDRSKIIFAGICLPFQLQEEIPATPDDIIMDLLYTM